MPKAPKPNICYHHYYYLLFKREVVCMHVVVNFGLCCRVNILRKMTNSIRHHISWFWKPFVHDKQLEKLWPNQYNATAEDYKSVCTSASPKFPFLCENACVCVNSVLSTLHAKWFDVTLFACTSHKKASIQHICNIS